jgi:hypothetical protein
MKLYNSFALELLLGLEAAATTSTTVAGGIGTQGSIDFFTNTTSIPATGMLETSTRVLFPSGVTPINTYATDGSNPGTRCTATFKAMTTGVVATGYTASAVSYFAILNTNAGAAAAGNVVLTGTVGTNAGDIQFNVTSWDTGDNISITSLTFVQPA